MRESLIIVVTLLFSVVVYGQEQRQFEIYFDQSGYTIDPATSQNREALLALSEQVDRVVSDPSATLVSIKIESHTSPEGGVTFNKRLSAKRTIATYLYLKRLYNLPDSLYNLESGGIWWSKLREMVANSSTPYREQVLDILDNTPEEEWEMASPNDSWLTMVRSRNGELMSLEGGVPYHYMMEHIFPELRQSSIITISFRGEVEPSIAATQYDETPLLESVVVEPSAVALSPTQVVIPRERRDIFALKTNLLFDLLLTPNISLEVPIGERWSVVGEWFFPWWVTRGGCSALEILMGTLELRYWFSDPDTNRRLTGWFAGVYGGGGLYDLQRKGKGYQGEFYIPIALSGGYAHTINRSGSLRLEYSLGVGYLKTNYRYYNGCSASECLKWQRDGDYRWVGPTEIAVSLVWMINIGRRGR